jgi:hypothetical protein
LFAHITRSWNGAPLLSMEEAAKRNEIILSNQHETVPTYFLNITK